MTVASTAAYVATEIGATNAFSFDLMPPVQDSYLGLKLVLNLLKPGVTKKVLVIGE